MTGLRISLARVSEVVHFVGPIKEPQLLSRGRPAGKRPG
jgi:hypothetical protein